jgi:hypothetical protein
MNRMFSIARAAAFAALALGAGALLTPAPAEAQGRHGYSGGGGARFAAGRVAAPRMGVAPRMGIRGGYGPRVAAPGFRAAGYRYPGYRPGVRPGFRPVVRPGWRPAYYNRGWYGGNYWPAAAGVGLGLVGAAAIANSSYYYANDGYYGAAAYPQSCWLERRTVRTGHGARVINVRVCPHY